MKILSSSPLPGLVFFIALLPIGCGHKSIDSTTADSFRVDMFDDWEDGNLDVNVAGGRFGHWYNYADNSMGTNSIGVVALDPTSERHATFKTVSKMSLRVQANEYNVWGSGFSASVAGGAAYDVSAYTGLVLWAKNMTDHPTTIRVVIPDVNSDPAGGKCDPGKMPAAGTGCYDAFGQNLSLTNDWQMYLMPFWSLQQLGYGIKVPTGLAVREIFQIAVADSAGSTYDYELDDVGFYTE